MPNTNIPQVLATSYSDLEGINPFAAGKLNIKVSVSELHNEPELDDSDLLESISLISDSSTASASYSCVGSLTTSDQTNETSFGIEWPLVDNHQYHRRASYNPADFTPCSMIHLLPVFSICEERIQKYKDVLEQILHKDQNEVEEIVSVPQENIVFDTQVEEELVNAVEPEEMPHESAPTFTQSIRPSFSVIEQESPEASELEKFKEIPGITTTTDPVMVEYQNNEEEESFLNHIETDLDILGVPAFFFNETNTKEREVELLSSHEDFEINGSAGGFIDQPEVAEYLQDEPDQTKPFQESSLPSTGSFPSVEELQRALASPQIETQSNIKHVEVQYFIPTTPVITNISSCTSITITTENTLSSSDISECSSAQSNPSTTQTTRLSTSTKSHHNRHLNGHFNLRISSSRATNQLKAVISSMSLKNHIVSQSLNAIKTFKSTMSLKKEMKNSSSNPGKGKFSGLKEKLHLEHR